MLPRTPLPPSNGLIIIDARKQGNTLTRLIMLTFHPSFTTHTHTPHARVYIFLAAIYRLAPNSQSKWYVAWSRAREGGREGEDGWGE